MVTLYLVCPKNSYVTNYVLPIDEEIHCGEILVAAAVKGGGEIKVSFDLHKEGIFPMEHSEYYVSSWDDISGLITYQGMWEIYDDAVNARSTETWVKEEKDQVICLSVPVDCDPSFIPKGFVKTEDQAALRLLREIYFNKDI